MVSRFRSLAGRVVAGSCLALTVGVSLGAVRHPLHTTITELTYDQASGRVAMEIRAFAEDFTAATALGAPGKEEPARSVDYLARKLELRGSDGGVVVLRWAGVREAEDLLFIKLEGTARAGLRGGTLRHGVLLDRFPDQVNILKVTYGATQRTLLFTKKAELKRLP